ncbi:MAG: IS66 family insertion sequence element accessory protein TnpB [Planctomycetes bacterium]|nr:IS66 family insertion sequence element accessory protein TnpB [Chloroflexota bacterium]MBA3845447.1 IS66 family insertion sequence element accessory protein TnpB [Planctomycetota bacterium]
MLNIASRRVFLARAVVDMRKSFDTLADVVRTLLGMDPFDGDAFVFVGRDRTRVKILIWDTSGFWVCAKRLEGGRFAVPPGVARVADATGALPLSTAEVHSLLEGIELVDARRIGQYRREVVNAPR